MWLADEDADVRRAARDSLRACLQVAYTGDRPDRPDRNESWLGHVDRVVVRCLRGHLDPDRPEPEWMSAAGAARVRRKAILATQLLALGSAGCLAAGLVIPAVLLFLLMAGLDIAEGAFTRVSGLRDPMLRWASCVGSHTADLALLGGLAAQRALADAPGQAAVMLVAMLATLLGSFVRVSALQAGYRLWRSSGERLARWASLGLYGVSVLAGRLGVTGFGPAAGVVGVLVCLTGFAAYTTWTVLRRSSRGRAVGHALLLFDPQTARCVSLEDGCEESRAPLRV